MNYTIDKKLMGSMLTLHDTGDLYVALEKGWQGFYYKDEVAFDKQTKDICYIPEYALDDFGGKTITIDDETYYRVLDIEDTYNYDKFINLTNGGHGKAIILFEMVDWQYPESLYQELEEQGEFEDYEEEEE